MLSWRQSLRHFAETAVIAGIGGALLGLSGIPAGWLSGAMIAVGAAALLGRPMHVPVPAARVIFILIGISLGGAVTPETLRGVATWPLSVALLAVAMVCVMFGSAYYLRRVHGWDTLSALFGSAPGALSQVIAHAAQNQSDLRGIAIVQTIRVMILTAGLPVALASLGLLPASSPRALVFDSSLVELVVLVAGSAMVAAILQWLRFPGGLIFGAMLVSAIMHGSGAIQTTMPWWAVNAVMVGLGAISGSRFANTGLDLLLRYVVAGLGSFAVAIAITSVFAAIVIWLLSLRVSDVVVSFSPGALDAMMILALALQLDPIFVGAHHVARFLLISAALPLFVRIFARRPPRAARLRPKIRPVQED
jgi:membrane AbrB-like protein